MDLESEILFGGQESRVQVNQRALVDKLLARYKGEYTVFRELIQNADDAKAKSVHIIVKSPKDAGAKTIIVKNDGLPFSEADWNRLCKIAEGNPNEDSVGCFGVGFYRQLQSYFNEISA